MLKHLFSFSSRANRTEFLFWSLILAIVSLVSYPLFDNYNSYIVWIFHALMSLTTLWFWYALCVRRFHDCNYSGWWVLIFFLCRGISFAFSAGSGVWMVDIAFVLVNGTPGENRFGTYTKYYYPAWMEKKVIWTIGLIMWIILSTASNMMSYSARHKQIPQQQQQIQLTVPTQQNPF